MMKEYNCFKCNRPLQRVEMGNGTIEYECIVHGVRFSTCPKGHLLMKEIIRGSEGQEDSRMYCKLCKKVY